MSKVIQSHMKYNSREVIVIGTVYVDGTSALLIRDAVTHEPIARATTNISGVAPMIKDMPTDVVYIKDYSENEGVLKTLLQGGIVETVDWNMENDHVTFHSVRIIDEEILDEIRLAHNRIDQE